MANKTYLIEVKTLTSTFVATGTLVDSMEVTIDETTLTNTVESYRQIYNSASTVGEISVNATERQSTRSIANDAYTSASAAQSTANAAQSAATSAGTVASGAQTTANSAQSTADSAVAGNPPSGTPIVTWDITLLGLAITGNAYLGAGGGWGALSGASQRRLPTGSYRLRIIRNANFGSNFTLKARKIVDESDLITLACSSGVKEAVSSAFTLGATTLVGLFIPDIIAIMGACSMQIEKA